MPTKPSKEQKKQPASASLSKGNKIENMQGLKSILPTTASDKRLKVMSNSRLEDLAQCPTWGLVHSQKKYETSGRSMALETGEVMHKVFAAVRIWQLWRLQKLKGHADVTGKRIFGTKWDRILSDTEGRDPRDHLLSLCFSVLHSVGWDDNPEDQIRTMSNMELAAITYVDERFENFNNWPVWVADKKDKNCMVGIEQVFDVVLEFHDGYKVRYIGTIDGMHHDYHNKMRLTLEDNKTAARMDTAFRQSMVMKHQFTGYMACSTAVFGFPVFDGRVWGLKIKRTNTGENCISIPIERDYDAIAKWALDVRWTMEHLHDPYQQEYGYEDAPRFTHSCNRYFRPCALLSFCADSAAGRRAAFDTMVMVDPSPSERAVIEG